MNETVMVRFGQYLLSKERKKSIAASKSNIPLNDRLKEVYHADVWNFWNQEQKSVSAEV